MYNQSITGDVAMSVTGAASDSHHIPCVIAFEPGVMSRCGGHVYEDVAGTVRANAGDNQQAVAYDLDNKRRSDTED